MLNMELAQGARKIVELCGNVQSGERVLIVTDTGISFSITEALAFAARGAGAEVSILITAPGEKPGEEPGLVVSQAMMAADVIFSPTTRTIFHSMAVRRALEGGARLLSLTEITEKVLRSGGIEADFLGLQPVIQRVLRQFQQGRRVRVTTEAGTNLWLEIEGRSAHACTGLCHSPGQKIGIPEMEVFIAPVESKTNGKLVIDGSASGVGRVETPIVITIENGKALSIEGGLEARRLRQLLEEAGEDNSYVIAEFALGLNDKAKVVGDIIEDEGAYGTGHFAFGNNLHFGGVNDARIHLDMVYFRPTVEMDGEIMMEHGVLIPAI